MKLPTKKSLLKEIEELEGLDWAAFDAELAIRQDNGLSNEYKLTFAAGSDAIRARIVLLRAIYNNMYYKQI